MLLRLTELPENIPVAVEHEYDPVALDLEFVDLNYCDRVRLRGTVEKYPDSLVVRGSLKSRIASTCGRCLKRVEEDLAKTFEFFFDIKDRLELDITPEMREVLILEHPILFLCREDCKGLCPDCGTDRNANDCKCSKALKSDAFGPLKQILPKIRKRENR